MNVSAIFRSITYFLLQVSLTAVLSPREALCSAEPKPIEVPLVITLPAHHNGPAQGTLFALDHGLHPLPEPQPMPVTLPSTSKFLTSSGRVWEFRVEVPGYWGAPKLFIAEPRSRRIEIPLFATSTVRGKVILPPGVPPLTRISVRFEQAVEHQQPASAIPRGTVQCPIEEAIFVCSIPAGTLDLRFRAEGFVSLYRWNTTLAEDETLDVGILLLRRGGSVVGEVQLTDPSVDPRGTLLLLLPQEVAHAEVSAAPGQQVARVRIDLPSSRLQGEVRDEAGQPVTATILLTKREEDERPAQQRTEEDGTFQFHGLDAGSYALQAFSIGGLESSDQLFLEVPENGEAPFTTLLLRKVLHIQGRVLSTDGGVP